MSKTFKARKVVRGSASGKAIVCPESFSFMGDLDLNNGEIIAADNPNKGLSVKGQVLIYKETKGSSGGCSVLMTLVAKGTAPAGIVTMKAADYNMTEGAILSKIPFLCCPDGDVLSDITTGQRVRIDADLGTLTIVES